MNLGSFKFIPKSFLGIDIGTSAIKVVELSRWGQRKSLKNYGELRSSTLYEEVFRKFEQNSLLLSSKDIARAIRAIFQEARIATKQAVFSLPDFSSFFTHFELPPLTKEELPDAVQFEARKHVPLPLSEVTFDWQVLDSRSDEKKPIQILLAAVPKEVINQYQEIAALAGIQLISMEAEVFGLIRSAVANTDKGALVLLDIGAQSTTVNLVYKKRLRISHSVDLAGSHLTQRIAQSGSIPNEKAEEQKNSKGISDPSFAAILSPLIDMLILEIKKVSQSFVQTGGPEIEKIIVAGGSSLLPGLKEYIARSLEKPTEIANPFQDIFYPPILEDTIKKAGPSLAVAVGMALRGLE